MPARQLRESKVTCVEIYDAHDGQVITCIKVYDGICASHLDIQVAEVIDVSSCQSGEVNDISPLFKIGRVMPF